MNYQKLYDSLMEKAKVRNWSKNTAPVLVEMHHIIPRSAGGLDEKHNIVALTIREHVLAHFILAKAKGGEYWRAAYGMSLGNRLSKCNSKIIERIRLEARESIRRANTGRIQPPEERLKRSKTMRSIGFVPTRAGDFDVCSKAGKANLGVKKSFRSESHSDNWRKSYYDKYPHWIHYDSLFELWKNSSKPKHWAFRKIAIEHGFPVAHYSKMVDKFKVELL